MTAQSDLTAADIAALLRRDAKALCWHLYPNGREIGGFFCIGSIEGEAGNSLKVQLRGPKQGTWADYARSRGEAGGTGDMLTLLQLALGLDIGGAVAEAKRWLRLDSIDPKALERTKARAKLAEERAQREDMERRERKRRNAAGLWRSSSPLAASSPPVRYLEARGIDFTLLGGYPRAIRFKPDMPHAERPRDWRGPAMISLFVSLEGQMAGAHVTWLERRSDGRWTKLQGVESAKKIFAPTYWGAHLPLTKGDQPSRKLADIKPGTIINIAEGIEDGLSFALSDPTARVVAAGTLGNIGALEVPPQAGDIVLLAQHDTDDKPVRAREAAIAAQQRRSRDQQARRTVRCRWPDPAYHDWNDWLLGKPKERAA